MKNRAFLSALACRTITLLALLAAAVAGLPSLSLLSPQLHAQSVPQLLNYQGRVAVGGTNFNGSGQFRFALVNANGTQTYWSNDGTSSAGSQPTNAVTIPVSNGLYAVLLGDTSLSNMTAIPASVFANSDVRLRVWFNDGTNGSQLLSPDERVAAVGYALMADGVKAGGVTNSMIATGAVSSTQIAAGAVGATQLASGSVSATQIADSSITGAKISTGQVVKSVNGLSDAVTLSAGANISITPAGNTLTLASTGGAGVWSLNGTTAYYNNGKVGIGTNTPAHELTIAKNSNTPTWTSNGWLGEIALDSGSAIAWAPDSNGTAFGMGHTNNAFYMFHTASKPGDTSNAAMPDFNISDNGNLAIGTSNVSTTSKVLIYSAQDALGINGYNPFITMFDSGANNAATRIQSVGGGTNLFTQNYIRGADLRGFIRHDSTGRLGVGTAAPAANVEVQGDGTVESMVSSSNERAIVSLNSTINGANRVWTLENGVFGNAGVFAIYDRTAGRARLSIDASGTVSVPVLSVTGGADVAEPFPMQDEESVEKGSVVVIDAEHPGRLKRSTRAYDKRVAGIVSGANGINPGIALHQEGALDGGQNVALSGRVYVRADNSNGDIQAGDLLTTSDIPGHAMKATDWERAHGAVLGKAMSPLRDKEGTVLVLVTLQ